MEREKVIFFRNVLLRAFVVGVVFALLLFGATIAFWDVAASMVLHFFKVNEDDLGRIVLSFFANVRLILVFFFLAPALALHWTAKRQ